MVRRRRLLSLSFFLPPIPTPSFALNSSLTIFPFPSSDDSFPVVYMSGNLALNGLNLFWFTQMVRGMARRLRGERKGESGNGNGALTNGKGKKVKVN